MEHGDAAPTSRRAVLASLGGLPGMAIAGCLDRASNGFELTEGFEDGLEGWEREADVPDDPNNPGETVAWSIDRSTDQAASGEFSLAYDLDGRQDDGTIWVVTDLEVEPDRRYDARMSAMAWSESESFNTLAYLVMYLGPNRPTDEESFPGPNENSTGQGWDIGGLREPLNRAEGWERYEFTWRTPRTSTGILYVAIGVTVVWETQIRYFVDDVSVVLESR
ncbi:MAG: hypothetical protein ACOC42_00565 [Halobacteriota archaeon]